MYIEVDRDLFMKLEFQDVPFEVLEVLVAYLNQKVLLIDLDPKADASKGLGLDTSSVENNIYN